MSSPLLRYVLFFFNDTATTEIYTLSLHDALPIWDVRAAMLAAERECDRRDRTAAAAAAAVADSDDAGCDRMRSEEHTSELQSRRDLVCRLLLEKKKKKNDETIEETDKIASLKART